MMPSSGYLTVQEVARRHGVTPRAVRLWCQRGMIFPCKQQGGIWLIGINYIPPDYVIKNMKSVKESGGAIPQLSTGKRGRPPGTGGSYPAGVKRPRKLK